MNDSHNGTIRPKLTNAVEAARDAEDAVFLLREGLGVAHTTFHLSIVGVGPLDYPFVRTTYPPEWISHYVLRAYLRLDPVIRHGFAAARPFAWHELVMDEREQAFMADARAHGVGAEGYSVPTVDRFGRRSLFSLNANVERARWVDFTGKNASTILEIGKVLHHKALVELAIDTPGVAALAPREAECLLWTARGKDAKAIAAILALSEFTVRSYLRTARQKLQCRTLSQAVAKAVQQRIINP